MQRDGVVVEQVTAPGAVLLDALSFLVAAGSLGWIRGREDPPPQAGVRNLRQEVREGLRFVFTNRYLRAFAGEAATFNFFSTALTTVFLLYATRDLGMGPGVLGAVIASSSVGGLIGSLLAERAGRRLGLGPTIVAAMLLGTWPYLLVPLASGSGPASLAVLGAAFLSAGCGIGVSSVHVISLRQTITPDRLMGRMNASYRFVVWGTIAAGALLGGALGSAVGLRGAVLIAAVGIAAAPTWIILSPIRSLRTAGQAATAAQPDEPLATGRA